jgi:hypothetical protein
VVDGSVYNTGLRMLNATKIGMTTEEKVQKERDNHKAMFDNMDEYRETYCTVDGYFFSRRMRF